MNPQEKAIELYLIYYNRIEHTLSEEYSPHEKDIVKECALILANEMVNEIVGNGLNIDFGERHNYWQEVKQEIDKL